jgi:mannitol/fructose-specific phosphotransferase system IIA component
MMKRDNKNIHLQVRADGNVDAIRQVGCLLVQSGHIEAGYIESMLAVTTSEAICKTRAVIEDALAEAA